MRNEQISFTVLYEQMMRRLQSLLIEVLRHHLVGGNMHQHHSLGERVLGDCL